jgi:hypothetical protein
MTFSSKLLACGILASSLWVGCTHPLLSSIEVKASPTVYAALGTSNYQLSSYLSASTIQKLLGGSSGATVYDYQDSTTVQKFLVRYPLTSVQLDFGQYLNSINLGSSLTQSLTPGLFQVPSINQSSTQNASFDLNGALESAVNGQLGAQSTTVVETGLPSASATLPPIPISISDFSSATFASGSFHLLFAPMTGQTAGFTLKASEISLVDGSGATLASTASSVDLVAGGTASISLVNVTLSSSFKVSFTATTSGGTPSKQDTVKMTPSLTGVAVSSASGVNFTTSANIPAFSFPVNGSGTLVSATIGTGSLTITQASLPAGWTGFTGTTNIGLAQAGGFSPSPQSGQIGSTISFNLANQTINANPITVTASSTITASGASFSGLNGPLSLQFAATVNVSLFSSIMVQPGSAFTPTQNFTEPLSSQMQQWIQSITFSQIGVQFNVSNNLPAGNPMTIVMTSNALGITGQSPIVLPSGQSSGQSTPAPFTNNSFTLVPKTTPNLDFKVTVEPQSYVPATGQMTLNNITPGSSLAIGGNATVIDTWTYAVVSPPTGGYASTFPSDGSKVNLSSLASYLGSNLTFKSPITSYLYVSGLPNATMTGQITAQYTGAGVPHTYTLLASTASLTMLSAAPSFPSGSIFNTTLPPASAPLQDLSVPLNAEPSDLTLSYNLNVGTVTVPYSSANSNPTVEADLVAILPLTLMAAAGGATLNFDNSMPSTDLFGRSAGQDNSSINNLLAKLTSLSMTINMTNTTGLAGTANLTDTQGFTKNIPLTAGANATSITLLPADIQHVINTVPFVPRLRFNVGQGELDIQRGSGILATVTVKAVTDVDQTYNLNGGN